MSLSKLIFACRPVGVDRGKELARTHRRKGQRGPHPVRAYVLLQTVNGGGDLHGSRLPIVLSQRPGHVLLQFIAQLEGGGEVGQQSAPPRSSGLRLTTSYSASLFFQRCSAVVSHTVEGTLHAHQTVMR